MDLRRQAYIAEIADGLSFLATTTKARSRAALLDGNRVAETICKGLLNALFAWDLENLNAEHPNQPAADLGDRGRRIAVQVTNKDSSDKIRDTAAKAATHRLGERFDRLVIFFLLPEKPGLPKAFSQPPSGPQIETWDIADLLRTLLDIPLEKLAAGCKVLKEETGTVAKLRTDEDAVASVTYAATEHLRPVVAKVDDEIGSLGRAAADAINDAVLDKATAGKLSPQLVEELRRSDPYRLVELLDYESSVDSRDTARLRDQARFRATLYVAVGRLDHAEESSRRAIKLDDQDARSWRTLAVVFATASRHEEARQALDKAIALSPPGGRMHAESCYAKAVCEIFLRRTEFAVPLLETALNYAKLVNDGVFIVQAAAYLGWAFDLQKQHERAVPLLEEALRVSERLGDTEEAAECACHLGVVYLTLGNKELSESMHRRSLGHATRINDVPKMGQEAFNVGRVCYLQAKHKDAYEMMSLAADYGVRLNDATRVLDTLWYRPRSAEALARVAAEGGQWREAERWASIAASTWIEAGKPDLGAAMSEWRDSIAAYLAQLPARESEGT